MTLDEFYSTFEIKRLDRHESVRSFSCGDEDLDDFILNDASPYRNVNID